MKKKVFKKVYKDGELIQVRCYWKGKEYFVPISEDNRFYRWYQEQVKEGVQHESVDISKTEEEILEEEREKMIKLKIEELAIEELKKEGKLPNDYQYRKGDI